LIGLIGQIIHIMECQENGILHGRNIQWFKHHLHKNRCKFNIKICKFYNLNDKLLRLVYKTYK
jgi:hypothetical protein